MKVIIKAKCIISCDANLSHYEDGFIAIENGTIIGIGEGDGNEFTDASTKIIDYEGMTILPGFVDVHCFFSGYALSHLGCDLTNATTCTDVANILMNNKDLTQGIYIGRNLPENLVNENAFSKISELLSDRPILIFYQSGESCWLNDSAQSLLNLSSGSSDSERIWPVIQQMFHSTTFIESQLNHYMNLLNSRGITSVKDMTFDDGYGLLQILSKFELEEKLNLRFHVMSQPVSQPLNLDIAIDYRKKYHSDYLCFSGFNRMTDGSISQFAGDLKKPYQDLNTCCTCSIDYDQIRYEVLKADANGFRFSLHAQGDAAVAKCIDIYSQCQRNPHGKLVNRHCITDLELTDPTDLDRMGWLGIIAEIYPQIPSLYNRVEKLELIESKIGSDRGQHYWNRRKMVDAGVVISCATDLPLLVDDIPESIYHACGAFFDDEVPFNPHNSLSILELLKAWTYGGAYNLGTESKLGSLEIGKLADFTVLDENLLSIPIAKIRSVKVHATWLSDKGCVYQINNRGE